jgi:beta-glucosidase
MAAECMVLLKNNGVLPLCKSDKIAFIGEFAEKPRFQGGGSSHINCFKTTSALDAAEGLNLVYAKGFDIETDSTTDDLVAEAVAAARSSKAAIIFAGLPDAYESEGYDRTHMRMPDCQNELIKAVAAVNPNTVVVLHNGSPVEMPWAKDVKGILEAYLGGQAVGLAAVRVLYGDENPCGKLPETFPLKLEDNPSYLFYGGEGDIAEYREGVFVGYRYYDKKNMNVLYPFGHGLSYTTFEYSNLRVDKKQMKDTDTITVTVDVRNTGKVYGKEIVQLYIADLASTVKRPLRELKGFEKIALDSGEVKTISFTLDKRAFAYWNKDIHDWHVETGEFDIEIGKSSRDIVLKQTITVESTVKLPVHYDMNTIIMDVMADPECVSLIKPLIDCLKSVFMPEEDKDYSTSKDAISDEMMEAMIQSMPIRAVVNFGIAQYPENELLSLLDKLNQK